MLYHKEIQRQLREELDRMKRDDGIYKVDQVYHEMKADCEKYTE